MSEHFSGHTKDTKYYKCTAQDIKAQLHRHTFTTQDRKDLIIHEWMFLYNVTQISGA